MSKKKCVDCNYMSFVKFTLDNQKNGFCADCGSMQEVKTPTGNLYKEVKLFHDSTNKYSKELKFGKDYFGNEEGFEEQYLQDAHKMPNKFAVLEINNLSTIAKKNAEKSDLTLINSDTQQSGDRCMYCDSNHLEVNGDSAYCKKCFNYQEEPLLGYQPMLILSTGKIIVLDYDGPSEIEVPDNTCRYCRHTELVTILDDKVCSFCNKLQSVQNFISINQIQFELSSGKLMKLIDDQSSDDEKGLKEITATLKLEKSKNHIAE